MTDGDAPELLDRGDVAVGSIAGQAVRMDTPVPSLQWIDTAFRLCRAHWAAALSQHRVSPEQGASQLCIGVSRDLDRDALPDGGSQAASEQGIGNG